MSNASNAESANNVKHLWQYCPGFRTETFSSDSPTDFSHGPVVVQPVRKYVVKSRFPFDLLSSLTFVANSARNECFVLSTSHFDCCLLASDWTHCSTLSASFSIFIISFFDHFAENVSRKCVFKKGYKLLDYDRSPLFDLIKSFLHSRSLIAYGLAGCSKNHFYLENCPAFNGSPVTCLRTCLSKVEFPEHIFLLLALFGNNISALQVSSGNLAGFPGFLACSIANVRLVNQRTRSCLILVVCQGCPVQPCNPQWPTSSLT